MQRQNSILKSSRKAMAMIMAIAVIVIISTIMALSLALTSQGSKRTTDLYLYEQSVLLSKSATEYALLLIAQNDASVNPCAVTNINFTQDTFYDVNITIKYAYTALCAIPANSFAVVQTPEQNGSVLIDVSVSVTDPTVSTEPIRYFRRSIQKL